MQQQTYIHPFPLSRPVKRAILVPSNRFKTELVLAFRLLSSQSMPAASFEPWSTHIADAFPCSYFNTLVVVGPVVGAPAVSIVIGTLVASGAEQVILFGAGGILGQRHPEACIGDIILPSVVDGDTETACHASVSLPYTFPRDMKLENIMQDHLGQRAFHRAHVWSTACPYTEAPQTLEAHAADFVEMELAALITACRRENISASALFVVSDILAESWQPGFSKKEFREGVRCGAQILASFLFDES